MNKTTSNLEKDTNFLVDCLRKEKSYKDLSKLMDDLFTEAEITDFAQRLRIARGLIADKTYLEVSDKVEASTSTITKIGQVIKYGKGAFQKLFEKR